jgi:hypothetical protein
MFTPLEDGPAARFDRDPEVLAIPVGERVYITSAKEDPAEAGDSRGV